MSWKETLQSIKAEQASGITPSVVFNSLQDIKGFVAAIKQDPELEDTGGLQSDVNSKVFQVRYGLGSKRRVSLLDILEFLSFSPKVFFESEKDLCLFASLFDYAITEGIVKESAEDESIVFDRTKIPNEEKQPVDTSRAHTSAEDVLNIVAVVILVLSIIAGFVLIVSAISVAELVGYVEILKIKIWLGAILILNGFVLWALFRVVANISQSLIRIDKKLKN